MTAMETSTENGPAGAQTQTMATGPAAAMKMAGIALAKAGLAGEKMRRPMNAKASI